MRKVYVIAGAACIVAAVALIAASVVFWGSRPGQASATGDIDRHFIEQMIPHHEDAVLMAEFAITMAEHPALRELAENIKRDQSREIDEMRSWYRSWYGADPPDYDGEEGGSTEEGMMGMGMMGRGMMGGHTDLRALETAQQFDQEFIRQMVPHHRMGVMMARMVLRSSERPEIRELARSIITTQSDEISQMLDWHRDWYGD